MSNRAYTVAEIDALQIACKQRWLFGSSNPTGTAMSRSYKPEELDAGVHRLIRTYMLAGIVAADLYAEDAERSSQ